MSIPDFSARAALYQVSRIYRAASGHDSVTAGVQPAAKGDKIEFECKWGGCGCKWESAGCSGYSTYYSDGWVTHYECKGSR
jgi:hypothetical protein